MKQGFTLIELLVVVLVIGILAAVALPQYQKAVMKTRVMSMLPLLKAISDAEQIYFLANGQYSMNFEELSIDLPAGGTVVSAGCISYPQFVCYLRHGPDLTTTASAYCNRKEPGSPSLEKYFSRKEFLCWAGTDAQDAICKSVSGKTTAQGSGGGSRAYYLD